MYSEFKRIQHIWQSTGTTTKCHGGYGGRRSKAVRLSFRRAKGRANICKLFTRIQQETLDNYLAFSVKYTFFNFHHKTRKHRYVERMGQNKKLKMGWKCNGMRWMSGGLGFHSGENSQGHSICSPVFILFIYFYYYYHHVFWWKHICLFRVHTNYYGESSGPSHTRISPPPWKSSQCT